MNILIDLATNTIHVDGETKLSELIDKIKNVYELDPESFSISTNPPSGYEKQNPMISRWWNVLDNTDPNTQLIYNGCEGCTNTVCHCIGKKTGVTWSSSCTKDK